MSLRVLMVIGVGLVQACFLEPDVAPIEIQAFRCAVPARDVCEARGQPIPDGMLPPLDEAFVVLARYQGVASVWTLIYPSLRVPGMMDSTVTRIPLADSAEVWINLRGGREGFYVQRVRSSGNVPDSLVWEFRGR